MNSSPEINELAAALAKAQAVMTGALKDSENPFFKSNYADLESVWHACRKCLTDNGLSVAQFGTFMKVDGGPDGEGEWVMVTRLLHSSGQWLEGSTPIRAKDDSAQAMGSAITYARRYGLAAMVGVYQTDDDAEAAQGRRLTAKQIGEYAAGFRDHLVKKNHAKVLAVHDDLMNEGQEAYSLVWSQLGSGERAAIKESIAIARDAKR